MQNMPITTTVTKLQRNFNDAVKEAEELSLPLLVISNSKPRGVYTPYRAYTKKSMQDDKDDLLSLSGALSAVDADKLIKDVDEMFETVNPEDWK